MTGRRAAIRIAIACALVASVLGSTAAEAADRHPVRYSLLAGIAAQLRDPGAAPPGANDFSCRPSAEHPEPVVLVHGLLANMTVNWQTISPLLANHGYCVFALTYGEKPGVGIPGYSPGGLARMEESAAQLSAFVDRVLAASGAAEVDIVGHSEGSLMPNYYVKFLGGAAKVDDYVGITPLWDGTKLLGAHGLERMADAIAFGRLLAAPIRAGIDAFCASCRQFLHGSEFLRALNEGGAAVPGVTYTNIMTRIDGLVVPYTSGVLHAPNATNIVVQDQCRRDRSEHATMAADPVVARNVLNALDPASAAPIPCPLVLPLIGAPLFSG